MKPLKYLNFVNNYNFSHFDYTALFVRIIPTDNCNLNCLYCFQRKNNTPEMTWEMFEKIFSKAKSLKTGFISFLGGEPMLWEYIYDAVELCTEYNILTDITTNGTLLNNTTIEKLSNAKLDYLNISTDIQSTDAISEKNIIFDKEILKELKMAEKNHNIKLRINSVIYNNNFEDIKLLLELSKENKIPISLGFVVPNMNDNTNKSICFSQDDTDLLTEITNYILEKKNARYPIIDPDSYFTNIFRFLKNESFWKCNYPTKYGWINVTPDGSIRGCTKKMDTTDFDFISLTPENIKEYKALLKASVNQCNPYCYSNCAYDSSFYKDNKATFIIDNFKNFFV